MIPEGAMNRKQMSIRLDSEVAEVLAKASQDTGKSANQLIQEAILKNYVEPQKDISKLLVELVARVEALEQHQLTARD
jgi:predicted DNA-binding protein